MALARATAAAAAAAAAASPRFAPQPALCCGASVSRRAAGAMGAGGGSDAAGAEVAAAGGGGDGEGNSTRSSGRRAGGGRAGGADGAGEFSTHYTPLSPVQRAAVAAGSAIGALLRPARADLVAALGETTGEATFERLTARMAADPTGARILSERPRLTLATLEEAEACAPRTLGAAYAAFMRGRRFEPEERPPARFLQGDVAYVAQRAREVHDFWHVLFGCGTTVPGEVALKWVEAAHTGLPMALLSGLGGPLRLPPAQAARAYAIYAPWALRAGTRCADLLCIYYEEHLHEDLESLRREWRIEPAPHPELVGARVDDDGSRWRRRGGSDDDEGARRDPR